MKTKSKVYLIHWVNCGDTSPQRISIKMKDSTIEGTVASIVRHVASEFSGVGFRSEDEGRTVIIDWLKSLIPCNAVDFDAISIYFHTTSEDDVDGMLLTGDED